ncbi:MAG: peptide chain release factor N(5)-glutamine methyltransferase [Gemmatimonadota bacterium]
MSTRPAPVEPPVEGAAWTLLHLLRWSTQYLEQKGLERPRLDVELLLAHALGVGRLDLYLQFDRPLERAELDAFRPLLLRRGRREPLQYVVGSAAFRELELLVDPRVLIPRPETEGLVGHVLDWAAARGAGITGVLEIATGSGAIALSLRREGSFGRIVASDLSGDALEVARANAARLGLTDVEWRQGDGLSVIESGERFDVLVANPPYVAWSERPALAPEVADYEPAQALFADEEGLALVNVLIRDGGRVVAPGGLLALEIGAGQGAQVADLARDVGSWEEVRVAEDLSGKDRYLLAARRSV